VSGSPGPSSSCSTMGITFAAGATASWQLASTASLVDVTVAVNGTVQGGQSVNFGSTSGQIDLSIAGSQVFSSPQPANYTSTITLQPEDSDTDGVVVTLTCNTTSGKISSFSTSVIPGVAPSLQASPNPVNFANTGVGSTTATQTVTITNNGAAAANGLAFSNSNGGEFPVSNNTCGTMLNVSASCTFDVAFKPSGGGARSATFAFTRTVGPSPSAVLNGVSVTARGTGLVDLSISGSLTFGTQTIGTTSAPASVTVTNTSASTVTVSGVTSDNTSEFPVTTTCGALAPNASCTVTATFKPSAVGGRSANITITSTGAGSPQVVPASGTGAAAPPNGQLSFATTLTFGTQTVGTSSAPSNVTVTNIGGTAVTVSGVTSSAPSEFAISGNTCTTVAAGANCTITVTFTPSAAGARNATITVTSTGTGSPQSISANGTGTPNATPGQISVPASLSFATQDVGTTSAPSSVTVTNTGGTPVTVSGVTSTNPGEFAIASSNCGTVAPGTGCTVTVTFTPSAAGQRVATITIANNGATGPQSISVTGTGSTPTQGGQLTFPGSIAFPDTTVGAQSATSVLSITNTGGTAVTITGITNGNAAVFVIVSDNCSGTLVQPGASCQLGIAFKPNGTGGFVASITVTSNGNGSPQTLSLSGNGVAAAGIDMNQQGLTGSWFQPATNGQGVELEVYPNLVGAGVGFVQGSWFTFDYTAAGGASSQRWYTFGGNATGGQSTATFTLYQNVGGNFDAPPITTAVPVGTVTLTFTDCMTATLTFQFNDGSGRSGTIQLVRLTPNVTCSASSPHPTNADFGYSGNWYDPLTAGQGFVFEVNPTAGVVFFAWYTYAPNGQSQGAAGQRWYTGQANYNVGARTIQTTLYETTGGLFNAANPASHTVPVGTATVTFTSCGAGQVAFNFTAGSSAGSSGTINVQRVGPIPAGCS